MANNISFNSMKQDVFWDMCYLLNFDTDIIEFCKPISIDLIDDEIKDVRELKIGGFFNPCRFEVITSDIYKIKFQISHIINKEWFKSEEQLKKFIEIDFLPFMRHNSFTEPYLVLLDSSNEIFDDLKHLSYLDFIMNSCFSIFADNIIKYNEKKYDEDVSSIVDYQPCHKEYFNKALKHSYEEVRDDTENLQRIGMTEVELTLMFNKDCDYNTEENYED